MKGKFVATITVLAFIASFLLANYLSENGISFHSQFHKALNWVESLFDEPLVLDKPPESFDNLIEKPKPFQHVEVGIREVCKDTSLGEVKYKKQGNIYTWVDERGITNFSSTPPNKGEFTQLNFAGKKVLDYFNLNLNTENLPYDFHKKLTLKLNKLFEIYGQLLDQNSLKKIDINLRVFVSKQSFSQAKIKHNMPISNNTPGFYSHSNNQAYLLLTNNSSTMRTATHEAVHAINRGIIGYTPKWLNEGLAEYSEYIDVKDNHGKVYPNKSWSKSGRITEKLLPLDKLLSASKKEWNSSLRLNFYASSWAFIHFMMDNPQRKTMLAKIIRYEQQNLCDVISMKQLEQIIGMPIRDLQVQFSYWSKRRLRVHKV